MQGHGHGTGLGHHGAHGAAAAPGHIAGHGAHGAAAHGGAAHGHPAALPVVGADRLIVTAAARGGRRFISSPRAVFSLFALYGAFGNALVHAAHLTTGTAALVAVAPALLVEGPGKRGRRTSRSTSRWRWPTPRRSAAW
jgi:hypothetical protein